MAKIHVLLPLIFLFKDDAYWWQARKESERTARAGLIPSRALQERRIIHERTQKEANNQDAKSKLPLKWSQSVFIFLKNFGEVTFPLNSLSVLEISVT